MRQCAEVSVRVDKRKEVVYTFNFLPSTSSPIVLRHPCGPSSGPSFVVQQLLMQGIISVGLFLFHYLQAFTYPSFNKGYKCHPCVISDPI